MKSLVQINDLEDYGCPTYGLQECNNSFFINLERLWKDSNDESIFINNYMKVYLHEFIHYTIHDIINSMYTDKEEVIVDAMADSEDLKIPKKYLCQRFK